MHKLTIPDRIKIACVIITPDRRVRMCTHLPADCVQLNRSLLAREFEVVERASSLQHGQLK